MVFSAINREVTDPGPNCCWFSALFIRFCIVIPVLDCVTRVDTLQRRHLSASQHLSYELVA
jgi:hypothetical protein